MSKIKARYFIAIYVGFYLLELSRTVLYSFYYGFLKKKFGVKVSLLYTNTDSFILIIETDNFSEFMKKNIIEFDKYNYKSENKFNIPVTEFNIDKMRDDYPV